MVQNYLPVTAMRPCGRYNLSFDAWCYHKQIPSVTRLARAFPDTPICLCHLGSPVFLEGKTNVEHVQGYDEVSERTHPAAPRAVVTPGQA